MIPPDVREEIAQRILSYLEDDGLYIPSAQDKARYFRNTTPNSLSPFGTSGTHSSLEVIVEDIVYGLTDYYGVSGTSAIGSAIIQMLSLVGDVSGTGTSASNYITTTIINDSVTFPKMQNVNSSILLGRGTSGTGDIQMLSASEVKTLLRLNNVENIAISTWGGSDYITNIGHLTELQVDGPTVLNGDLQVNNISAISLSATYIYSDSLSATNVTTQNVYSNLISATNVISQNISATNLTTQNFYSNLISATNVISQNVYSNIISASNNVFVGGNISISGDFFNPHVSILNDGVISTDSVIYAEYLEVYNIATFDNDVFVLGDVSITGTVSASNLQGTNTGDQTITLTGDVSGSGTGTFPTIITNNAVTLSKFQQVQTDVFLGRDTSGTGNIEIIPVSAAKSILGINTNDSPTFANLTVSGLNASQAVFTNGVKQLVSNAITGTGNVVMSSGGTIASVTISGAATVGASGSLMLANFAQDRIPYTGVGGLLSTTSNLTYNSSTTTFATANGGFSGNVSASGNLTVGTATGGTREIQIDGASGNRRILTYRTAGLNRWTIRTGNGSETGSDAGSDLEITAFADTGAGIDNPITIARATGGSVTIIRPVTISNTLLTGAHKFNNSVTSAFNTDSAPAIYGTSDGLAGPNPFNLNGHLVLQARTGGGSGRDIIFYSGTTPTIRYRLDPAGTHTFTDSVVISSLSASMLVATNGSKVLTSSVASLSPIFAGITLTGTGKFTGGSTINGTDANRGYAWFGADSGQQIEIDDDDIQSMNNTTPSTLYVNRYGGLVRIGTHTYFYNNNQIGCGYDENFTTSLYLNIQGYQNGTTQFRDLVVGNGKNSAIATFEGSTKNVYVFGQIRGQGTDTITGSAVNRGVAIFGSSSGQQIQIDDDDIQSMDASSTATIKINHFGGAVLLGQSGGIYTDSITLNSSYLGGADSDLYINYRGYLNSTLYYRGTTIFDGRGNIIASFAASTKIVNIVEQLVAQSGWFKTGTTPINGSTNRGLVRIGTDTGGSAPAGFSSGDALQLDATSIQSLANGTGKELNLNPYGGIVRVGEHIYVNADELNSGYTTNSDSAALYLNYRGYNAGSTRYRNTNVCDGRTGLIAEFDGPSKDVRFHGQIQVTGGSTITGTNANRGSAWFGASFGQQIQIDGDEIQSMNNTSTGSLSLNYRGGRVEMGTNGGVYISGNSVNGELLVDADSALYINYYGYIGGSTRYRDLAIMNGKGAQIAYFQGSTKQVLFHGQVQFAGGDAITGTNANRGSAWFGTGSGQQIQIDTDEIQSMNNTSVSTLSLNYRGGNVHVGGITTNTNSPEFGVADEIGFGGQRYYIADTPVSGQDLPNSTATAEYIKIKVWTGSAWEKQWLRIYPNQIAP